MNSMLQHIEQQLRQSEAKPGTLIHIGAGAGSELQEYLDLEFNRIVLYEAVPELGEELRERSRGYQQVSVEQALVGGQSGKVVFYQMNNPRFSSLLEQSALRQYYPNLSSTQVQMEAVSLADTIKNLELPDNETNILVLEVQGAETAILKTVEPELLQLFSWVIIRTVAEELLSEQSTDCASVLEKAEFMVILNTQESHPFTKITFRRDDSAISLKKVQAESERLVSNLKSELEATQDKFKAEKIKIETQLKEDKQSLENKLSKEGKRIKELEEQLKGKSIENQNLREELDILRNERQELIYRQTALDEEVVKAEAQLELIKDVVIRDKAF